MSIAPRTVSTVAIPPTPSGQLRRPYWSRRGRARGAGDLENRGRVIVVQAPSSTPLGPSSLEGRSAAGMLNPPRSSSRSTEILIARRDPLGATLHALHGPSASAMQKHPSDPGPVGTPSVPYRSLTRTGEPGSATSSTASTSWFRYRAIRSEKRTVMTCPCTSSSTPHSRGCSQDSFAWIQWTMCPGMYRSQFGLRPSDSSSLATRGRADSATAVTRRHADSRSKSESWSNSCDRPASGSFSCASVLLGQDFLGQGEPCVERREGL